FSPFLDSTFCCRRPKSKYCFVGRFRLSGRTRMQCLQFGSFIHRPSTSQVSQIQ
ncbi:unnamed protein product, partial [Musa textilis]